MSANEHDRFQHRYRGSGGAVVKSAWTPAPLCEAWARPSLIVNRAHLVARGSMSAAFEPVDT
jgi:hypothetical protein